MLQPAIRQILDNLFRAVVVDSFYGEVEGFRQKPGELGAGYVLAMKPTSAKLSQHKMGEIAWQDARHSGGRVKVVRTFKDGH